MGFEALDYISVHKKSFFPPLLSLFSKWKPKSGELHDLDAIRGFRADSNGEHLTSKPLDPKFLLASLPANSPAVWLCKNFVLDPPGIELYPPPLSFPIEPNTPLLSGSV